MSSLMERRRALMMQSKSGKEIVLLASGTYTKTDYETVKSKVEIPISGYDGTAVELLVIGPEANDSTFQWVKYFPSINELTLATVTASPWAWRYKKTGNSTVQVGNVNSPSLSQTKIICYQRDQNYQVRNGEYRWYVWGYKE